MSAIDRQCAEQRWSTRAAKSVLIALLSAVPVLVAFRFRWPQVLIPLALVPSIVLVVSVIGVRRAASVWTDRLRGPVGISIFLLIAWSLASLAWTPGPEFVIAVLSRVLIALLAIMTIQIAAETIDPDRLFEALTISVVLVIPFGLFTAITRGAIHQYVGCCVGEAQANMTGTASVIALFAPICAAWLFLKGRRRLALAVLVPAICLIAISRSGASGLALAAGLLTIGLGFRYPKIAVAIPLLIWIVGFATAPFLGELDDSSVTNDAVQSLARFHAEQRVLIWAYYDHLFVHRPWTGFGMDVARFLDSAEASVSIKDAFRPRNSELHPHNEPLQILIELGLIGMLLFLGVIVAATRKLARIANLRTAMAVAPASGFCIAGLVNFGIWEWWWITTGVIALICSSRLVGYSPPVQDSQPQFSN